MERPLRECEMRAVPRQGDALLIVDVQRDFLPGGALAVPGGDQVIEPLNRYVELFRHQSLAIFASRDWHPAEHSSFAAQGGSWPPHCVQNTNGARFSPLLDIRDDVRILSKGDEINRDSYSAFGDGKAEKQFKQLGVRRLWVGGLATEYCVLSTVRDAIARGFEVVLLMDAICALDADDGRRAIEEMLRFGVIGATLDQAVGSQSESQAPP